LEEGLETYDWSFAQSQTDVQGECQVVCQLILVFNLANMRRNQLFLVVEGSELRNCSNVVSFPSFWSAISQRLKYSSGKQASGYVRKLDLSGAIARIPLFKLQRRIRPIVQAKRHGGTLNIHCLNPSNNTDQFHVVSVNLERLVGDATFGSVQLLHRDWTDRMVSVSSLFELVIS